ncbi:hypothetical protein F4861DRAFT_342878 [Xylaria intraflava]|nr:hypothetical protein F4861DRAFT_342878 [Xylaria intraflava]
MQAGQPPGDSEPPPSAGQRSTSFGRLMKLLTNKESSAGETSEADHDQSTPARPRPRRNLIPTEADLNNNVATLQTTLKDAWPKRHHSRYRQAHALFVCWADCELVDAYTLAAARSPLHSPISTSPPTTPRFSAASDAHCLPRTSSRVDMRNSAATAGQGVRQGPFIPAAYQLANVFERRYGISGQVWMIPSLENPQDMLCGKIAQFVTEYGGPDNLLIFWYGGSAEFVGAPDDGARWTEGNGAEVVWYGLRDELGISAKAVTKALSAASSDVLFLNDSPFAQHAYMGHLTGPGTFEMLGSGSMVASNLERRMERVASFTRTLALMLDAPALATHGVSIPELHRKLLDVVNPGRPKTALPTAPPFAATTQRGGTSHGPPSTHLIASRAPTAQAPPYPVYCQISQAVQLEKRACRNIVLSHLNAPLCAELVHAKGAAEPRVRLDLRLKRPFLDVRRWREWIMNAPPDAKEIIFSKISGKEKDK